MIREWGPNSISTGSEGACAILERERLHLLRLPMRSRYRAHISAAVLFAIGIIVITRPSNGAWAPVGLWLAGVLAPGGMWSIWLGGARRPSLADWVVGHGLAWTALLVFTVVWALVGAPYQRPWLIGILHVALLIPAALALRPGPGDDHHDARLARGALGVALLAIALRVPFLGYSELQGDETEVLLRASALITGLPGALFYHGKPPGELLVAGIVYGLGQAIDESTARLPFALANVAASVAALSVGERLFNRTAGVIAGALVAIAGYYLAFARITQYQSLVLLLGTTAVLAALVGGARYRWSAGALIGAALLCHYDAVFATVPIAVIVAIQWRRAAGTTSDLVRGWLGPATLAATIPLVFFIPFSLSPLVDRGVDRVAGRVGDIALRNNLNTVIAAASLYLSLPVLVTLACLALVSGVLLVARRRDPGPWLVLWVWLAAPLLGYSFVVRNPGTHAHTALLPLLLLASGVLAAALERLRARLVRWGAYALLGGAGAAVIAYDVALFLAIDRELVRNNQVPEAPLGGVGGPALPRKERFGFPYRAGWKAIGTLYADGILRGSYDSNENPQITWWYTRGALRCTADPRYFIIADLVQDEIEPPRRRIAAEYDQVGTVLVRGQPRIRVFEQSPPRGPSGWQRNSEDMSPVFDRLLSFPLADPGVWARGPVSPLRADVSVSFGDVARFEGYELFAERPDPGGVVRVDLFWTPFVGGERYVPALRVGDAPTVGDGDGPGCDKSRAWLEWEQGRPFAQRLSVPIRENAAPGRYPILIRLVDTATGQLVSATGQAGNEVRVGELTVTSAPGRALVPS